MSRPLPRPSGKLAGFTLLEVSVALAILALGLVSIIDINSGATRLHEESVHLTLGTLLAKAKMIDLEQKLNEDGFSDFDQQIDGTFEDQSHPEIRWHAEILRPDVTKATDQITQLITSAMGGGTPGAAGSGSNPLASLIGGSSLIPPGTTPPSGSSASPDGPTSAGLGGALGAATGGLIQMEVTQLVQQIQSALREVRLTVTWPDGAREDSLSIATHLVVLQPTGSGVSSGAAAGQGTAQNTGTPNTAPGATPAGTAPAGAGNPLGNLFGGSLGGLH
jgi:general secretion pathway protein I